MNEDLNFSVSIEGLDEKGMEIEKLFKELVENIDEIVEAKKKLDSWKSVNKDKYNNRLDKAAAKMRELTDVISSFGGVARQTSRRLNDVENKIASAMEDVQ